MLPYLYVIVFSFTTFLLYDRFKQNNNVGYSFFLTLSLLSLLALSSFRASTVGTDTEVYLWMWSNDNDFSKLLDNSSFFSEFGFDLLSHITRYISTEYFSGSHVPFLLCIASLVVILNYASITKYSSHRTLSFICFLLLGFYTFHFNGARQAISISIFFFSFRYILNGNFKKYLLCLFIGFLFHKTILLCLPFYYFFRRPMTVRLVCVILFSSIILSASITVLVEIASTFDERYSNYANNDFEGGGLTISFFYIAMLFWLYFVKRINKINNQCYDISLLSMLIVSCLSIISISLSLNPSGILRITNYFSQFLILSIPISIYSFKNKITRAYIMSFAILGMVAYFYLSTSNFSSLAPYLFISS